MQACDHGIVCSSRVCTLSETHGTSGIPSRAGMRSWHRVVQLNRYPAAPRQSLQPRYYHREHTMLCDHLDDLSLSEADLTIPHRLVGEVSLEFGHGGILNPGSQVLDVLLAEIT